MFYPSLFLLKSSNGCDRTIYGKGSTAAASGFSLWGGLIYKFAATALNAAGESLQLGPQHRCNREVFRPQEHSKTMRIFLHRTSGEKSKPIKSNPVEVEVQTFSGWWFGTSILFSHILGMSSSQLTFIFFRGLAQPPTSSFLSLLNWCWMFHEWLKPRFHEFPWSPSLRSAETLVPGGTVPTQRTWHGLASLEVRAMDGWSLYYPIYVGGVLTTRHDQHWFTSLNFSINIHDSSINFY